MIFQLSLPNSKEVKIARMTLKMCYADGGCSECEIPMEQKQCSGAFLEMKKSMSLRVKIHMIIVLIKQKAPLKRFTDLNGF